MKISEVLPVIRPGAEWSISNDDYNTLIWLDKIQPEPTLSDIQVGIAQIQQQQASQAQAIANAKAVLANAISTPQQQIQALRTILGI